MGYIYLIENDVNNKKYVGLTTQTIDKRWKQHLNASKYKNYKLYYAEYQIPCFPCRYKDYCNCSYYYPFEQKEK